MWAEAQFCAFGYTVFSFSTKSGADSLMKHGIEIFVAFFRGRECRETGGGQRERERARESVENVWGGRKIGRDKE